MWLVRAEKCHTIYMIVEVRADNVGSPIIFDY